MKWLFLLRLNILPFLSKAAQKWAKFSIDWRHLMHIIAQTSPQHSLMISLNNIQGGQVPVSPRPTRKTALHSWTGMWVAAVWQRKQVLWPCLVFSPLTNNAGASLSQDIIPPSAAHCVLSIMMNQDRNCRI